ncbi:MAG: DUF2079 domain-containing protein [Acidimicrobiales bacterium]
MAARFTGPVLALAALVGLWVGVMGRLVWLRHHRFGSFGFDMGIFDQAVWLLSAGSGQLITVRGLTVFGHHSEPALYLFVPFYWLGAGPHFLNLAQVVSVAAGAVPVFLIARHYLGRPGLAVGLAAAYLLNPSLQFLAQELFHPEVMAITPLLFAAWFGINHRWRWFAACLIFAVAWKEDVALAAMAMGLIVAVAANRRVGLTTAGVALGYFVFVTRVMLPYLNGSEAFYNQFFGVLGGSATEIAINSVRDPGLVASRVLAPDAKEYYGRLLAPFGGLPLLAPVATWIGLPQIGVNVLSVHSFTRAFTFHYAALPVTALMLATLDAVRRSVAWSQSAPVFLVGWVLASALATTLAWGPSPIGAGYRQGWWPLVADARQDAKRAALATIPPDARVSAAYSFVPQLTHRPHIYEFPNPFRPSNWGVSDENYPPDTVVDWIAVDLDILGPQDREIFDRQLAGDFSETVFDDERIMVVKRPRPITHLEPHPGAL